MSMISEERPSDSPYIEKVLRGWTVSAGSSIRPSEVHWHMVFTRHAGRIFSIFVGPLTASGRAAWGGGAEILWIKFKLGVFLRPMPPRDFLDREMFLPKAGSQSFWLNGTAWQFPDFENVEGFVHRLAREEALIHDPVVDDVLCGRLPDISSRTLRHRFLRATGLTQLHVYQAGRAQRAEALLQQGVSILDTVFEAGYYDQPHLTRALKQFTGHTPGQIVQGNQPA
jgi:AraC-like DNA-binding protein